MLLAAILILFLLALINYRIGGRALLHPAVVFCAVWALDLALIGLVGDFFYPLSAQTFLIFVGGACAFSFGATLAFACPSRIEQGEDRPLPVGGLSQRLITWMVILEVLCLPFAIRWMLGQVSERNSFNFVSSMALVMGDQSVKATWGYSFFANLVLISNMIALIAFFEREHHRQRWRIAFTLGLGLDFVIAARSLFVPLFLGLLCLDWLKTRRIKWKHVFVFVAILFVLASAVAIYLGKLEAKPDATLVQNSGPVVQGLVMYAAGGPVAFDQLVRNPAIQPRFFQLGVIFIPILNKFLAIFGSRLEEVNPDWGPGFVELGPHHLETNIYTIYGEYSDLGYFGTAGLIVGLGAFITFVYKRALRGKRIACILYASFFSGMVLSTFTELFFANVYHILKLCMLLWVVYRFPSIWSSCTRILARGVKSALHAGPSQF